MYRTLKIALVFVVLEFGPMVLGRAAKPPQPILMAVSSDGVDISKKYFVGGVKDVPGDVVEKFMRCGGINGGQKTNPCSGFWKKATFCDPTLFCHDKKFWSKRKGWNAGRK